MSKVQEKEDKMNEVQRDKIERKMFKLQAQMKQLAETRKGFYSEKRSDLRDKWQREFIKYKKTWEIK